MCVCVCLCELCLLPFNYCMYKEREREKVRGSTLNMRIMNFCKRNKKRRQRALGLGLGPRGSNSKLRLLYGAMRENLDQLSQRLPLAYTALHRIPPSSPTCIPLCTVGKQLAAQFVKSLQFQKTLKSLQTQRLPTTCVAMRKIWKVFIVLLLYEIARRLRLSQCLKTPLVLLALRLIKYTRI